MPDSLNNVPGQRPGPTRPAKRPRGRPSHQTLPPSLPFPAALLPLTSAARVAPQGRTGGQEANNIAPAAGAAKAVMCLPNPDWLAHRLTVAGPAAALTAYQDDAAGPGVLPWRSGLAAAAENWFNRMVAVPVHARNISVAGAHVLVEQLHDALAARHALAGEAIRARACPLDLQMLIPMPDDLLGLGPDDPRAIAWLWAHWGTTWPLRHVTVRPAGAAMRRRLADGQGSVAFRFHAADWSPWPALLAMRARWPALRFDLRPDYGPGPGPGPIPPSPDHPLPD